MLGGDVGIGPTDPALVAATFSFNGMQSTTPETPFDPELEGVIDTSGQLEAYHAQASSVMFEQEGRTGEPIPEPSTALLLLAGAAGLFSLSLRRSVR